MMRKIGSLMVLLLVCFSLVGCGDENEMQEMDRVNPEEVESHSTRDTLSKAETDRKNLEEAEFQVQNCISDAYTQEMDISEGKIVVENGSVSGDTGIEKLVETVLSGCRTTSHENPDKTSLVIEIIKDGDGYDVTAWFE